MIRRPLTKIPNLMPLVEWRRQFFICDWAVNRPSVLVKHNYLVTTLIRDPYVGLYFFLKMAIPGLFFFYFRLFKTIQLTVNKCSVKMCRCLDTNRGPLVSEATALPTEPQPLPQGVYSYVLYVRRCTPTAPKFMG